MMTVKKLFLISNFQTNEIFERQEKLIYATQFT